MRNNLITINISKLLFLNAKLYKIMILSYVLPPILYCKNVTKYKFLLPVVCD